MKNRRVVTNIISSILVILIIIILLSPLINVLLKSLMSDEQSVTTTILPSPISFDGYAELKNAGLFLPFLRTMVISLIGTAISVIFIVMAAFAISRDDFKYGKYVRWFLYIQMVVPSSALIVARFTFMSQVGLINTYSSLIIAALCSYASIFIMESYIRQVPKSLVEMCLVNGGTLRHVLWDIVVPIVKPGIIFVSLLSFITYYNMYLEPLLFITDPTKQTLQVALRSIIGTPGEGSYDIILPNLQNAAIILTMSIVVVIIPLLNKYYIKGLTDGGVK